MLFESIYKYIRCCDVFSLVFYTYYRCCIYFDKWRCLVISCGMDQMFGMTQKLFHTEHNLGDTFSAELFLLWCLCAALSKDNLLINRWAVNHYSIRKHREAKQTFIYMKMLQIITYTTSPPCLSLTLCCAMVDWSIYHSQHIEKKEKDGSKFHAASHTHTHTQAVFIQKVSMSSPLLEYEGREKTRVVRIL